MKIDNDVVNIFQIIGTLATTAAVLLTLWQSGYNNQKKLKIIIDEMRKSIYSDMVSKRDIINLNVYFCVSNIGRYDISIREIGIKREQLVPANFFHSITNDNLYNFPLNIKVQETVEFQVFWNRDSIGILKNGDKIIFTDSTNKRYKIRIKQKDIDVI